MTSRKNNEISEHCFDSERNSYKLMKTVFQGQDVTFPPGYSGLNYVLNNVGYLQCKPQDIVLITYPKSGTHWVNKIICMLLGIQSASVSVDGTFIDIIKDFKDTKEGSEPTIFGSHMKKKYLPGKLFDEQKVIYVIRNPKSTAVSAYSHRKRSKESGYNGSFSGYFPLFLQGEFSCIGNWFQHVKSYWKSLAGKSNVLFIFYEELIGNPVAVIMEISSFLGCVHTDVFLAHVAEETSFAKMREKEQDEILGEGSEATTDWKEGEEGILRKGTIDDWKNYFTVAENEMFDSLFSAEMAEIPELRHRIKYN